MSIEGVCAAFKTIIDAVSAVTVASGESYELHGFNPPPPKLDTADLPAAYAFTGQASYTDGADWLTEERIYALSCPVMPVGQGTPEEREKRCRALLVAVRAAVMANPHLGVSFVQRTRVVGDSGVVILPEYDGAFYGFELRVSVTEIIGRSYAANE